MTGKRSRVDLEQDTNCTRHILPTKELNVKDLARERGCRSSRILAEICKGLPTDIHPAFELTYADVLGVAQSAESKKHIADRKAKYAMKSAKVETIAGGAATSTVTCTKPPVPIVKLPSSRPELQDRNAVIEAIEPAFRLASAVLTHGDQLPFWHGMQRAGKRAKRSDGNSSKVPAFLTKRNFTAVDRAITLEFLRELGQGIFITFCDIGNWKGLCWTTSSFDAEGQRNWNTMPRLPHDHRPRFARIELNAAMLMTPCLQWRLMTASQLRRMWFSIAETLLHELAHAATAYAFRNAPNRRARSGNVYFRQESVAEIGWSYTNYTFGGWFSFHHHLSTPMMFSNWPCPSLVRQYDSTGSTLAQKRKPPVYKVAGHVSAAAFDRAFEASFWGTTRKLESMEHSMSLKFERCCGSRRYDENGVQVIEKAQEQRARGHKRRKLVHGAAEP
ncbi:hypothetical protein LTR95_002215 [Oleoguttula sp. CCFEE 5521]